MYHIFSNNHDEWLDKEKDAIQLFNEWKKEYNTARLYTTIYNPVDEIWDDVDCIKSYGYFPY